MPICHRAYTPGELQFITTSTYRRAPVFFSPRFCHYFATHPSCVWTGWIELLTPVRPLGTSQTPKGGVCASPPNTVTKFSILESGSMVDIFNRRISFSASQQVTP